MRSSKVIYNIITSLISQIIVIIYGFVVPKLIISNFGSETNGLITSITQFLAYISLLESGIGPVIKSTLYNPIAKKDKKSIEKILKSAETFFRIIAMIFLIYIFVFSIIAPLTIYNNFELGYTIPLIIIISISTFAEYFFGMTYSLYIQANQKSYVISLVQSITYIINIIAIIILVKCNSSIHLIKLLSGIIFVIRPIIQNIYVRKKYNINLKNVKNDYKLKQKWDGLSQHIAAVIHGNTDVAILTFFCNLSEVSVYSVYCLVVKGIKTLVVSFTNSIESTFGDMIAKQEKDNLNNKFRLYETIFLNIAAIIFSCAMVLIVPFIKIYTLGITDTNYIRFVFGYLIVFSEYVYILRLPYISLTYAAGCFKETKRGAWIESISNIIISILLVKKMGIIGVTIGTLFAMIIRTIEFVYYSNKYILEKNILISFKKILIALSQTIIIIIIYNFLPLVEYTNYISWIMNAIIVFIVSSILVIFMGLIIYKKEYREIVQILRKIIKKR